MPNLTLTTAARAWLLDRRAVEFSRQWEATQYRFYVTDEALEDMVGPKHGVNIDSALEVFDDHHASWYLPRTSFGRTETR
ncbi:DUF1488 family protein [Novosphingobium sp. BL-8H]|uniref:DUF1488 family protein n=1 Tax=Novosphingobium sp. BL-8H TaxID=3127640 RepID=UPI0037579F91